MKERGKSYSVRLSDEEHERVQRAAARAGLSPHAWMRLMIAAGLGDTRAVVNALISAELAAQDVAAIRVRAELLKTKTRKRAR